MANNRINSADFDNLNKLLGNFIMVSRDLISFLGDLNAAVVFGEIFYEVLYSKDFDQKSGWLKCSIDNLEKRTGLGKTAQNRAIEILVKQGLIVADNDINHCRVFKILYGNVKDIVVHLGLDKKVVKSSTAKNVVKGFGESKVCTGVMKDVEF